MAPELSKVSFVFPNDFHVTWSLMIVLYPYITGLVAGAFIVSSLYHVFDRQELRPIGRLSLVASLAFLIAAPLPLLCHLGQPLRGPYIMMTPNLRSAMAGFGFVYTTYFILVALEIWLVFRRHIIEKARRSQGFKRAFYCALALWVYDTSPDALRIDRQGVKLLAALGIPLACLLHGYVGFIFGSVKANPWWSTPLMPIIFLFSACLSGIAMVIILYIMITFFGGGKPLPQTIQSLASWLWLFVIITVSLELLEIGTLAYERNEEWLVLWPLLTSKLAISFFGVQLVFGAMIPMLLLGIVVLLKPYLTDALRNTLAFMSACILLVQVFAMRWNVVIGGQMFSKSLAGFRDPYVPELLGREGVLAALVIFALPFIVMAVFHWLLPIEVPIGGDPVPRPDLPSEAQAEPAV
ncbi:MAG: polysulfide reductase NrfD [Armatimonadetes bacterium]|nr:polysulfide reductase NrfD [Armatimonadota bacterium]